MFEIAPSEEKSHVDDISQGESDFYNYNHSIDAETSCENSFSDIPNSIYTGFLRHIFSFRHYSLTIAGGSRSIAFLKMETNNLIILYNQVGEEKLFNSSRINAYLSAEMSNGKSPSTIQSRLFPLKRFLLYLRTHAPSILPNEKELNDVLYLIQGAGKSLAKSKRKGTEQLLPKVEILSENC